MKEMGSGISRDYLLPLPDQDKLEFRKAPAQYHHVLCMSRALLGGLLHCTWHPAKGWSSQTAKLMTPLGNYLLV